MEPCRHVLALLIGFRSCPPADLATPDRAQNLLQTHVMQHARLNFDLAAFATVGMVCGDRSTR